jgi:hypothetical protein
MRATSRVAPLLGPPFLLAALIGASAAPAASAASATPVPQARRCDWRQK